MLARDGSCPFPPHQWLFGPQTVSGTFKLNVGIFIKTEDRFAFPLAVVDLRIGALQLQLSEAQVGRRVRSMWRWTEHVAVGRRVRSMSRWAKGY